MIHVKGKVSSSICCLGLAGINRITKTVNFYGLVKFGGGPLIRVYPSKMGLEFYLVGHSELSW